MTPVAPDPGMARLERGLATAATVIATLGVFLATATLAARLPAGGDLGARRRAPMLEYSADTFGSVAPLGAAFIREQLRGASLAFLEPARANVAGFTLALETPVPRGASVVSSPAATEPPRPDAVGDSDKGAVSRRLAPGDWRLVVSIAADRATVQPGGDVVYSILVRNVGDEAFRGDFTLTSHVPFGTTSSQQSECRLPNRDANPCAPLVVPVPGDPTPEGSLHSVRRSPAAVEVGPGGEYLYRFVVTVSPGARRGTAIANHAHLAVGDTDWTSEPVTVVVK